ncbi:NUDIX hydrolase [Actinophytocola algeriensis]|uniref:8-oxo-dGTP diphosphatase n=1 Tax=Actinophytocola algeriensis TaxID=1768010 RepID=A0A7W7VFF7_9PSEU|nr:NUDIX hydrolase [Actinophytocola algeriensis]MBB4908278.1 8-oxo-dGTP diphosphatase [Actinophytocola algeriensis]MBE1480308.1 8-oxo-dGTP diphosphatase [Actinophytocola algeriensis]
MAGEIAAAGGVVWRLRDGVVEVALVYRERYGDWTLPKGKLEADESARVAAHREVREETGARVALGRFLGRTGYLLGADHKVVDYFAARYLDGEFVPSEEVADLRWMPVPDAVARLSHDRDLPVLAAFSALPADLTTVLLVRHAKAGSRAQWEDADELRPLSRNGEKQVPPVRELAAVYGAERVYSAPLVRCVETVRPVADDIGVPVVEEELLAERKYEGMADAATRRLAEIAAGGGVSVVCSQGGVIPDLVTRVAADSPVSLPRRVESKKGSVWALFFAGTHLVAADYIRVP